MPTVSFLIPVYNAEQFLRDTLDSILAQTFSDFEVLCVNDGSTDQSRAILAEFSQWDARFKIIDQRNSGQISAMNRGIEAAEGEFIARLDADDICLPTRLEVQVAYLKTHPRCDIVGSAVLLIDSDGEPIMEMPVPLDHKTIDTLTLQAVGATMVHPVIMIRTATMKRLGGYRPGFDGSEDVDLYLRVAEQGELANVPDVLLKYRQHLNSISYAQRGVQDYSKWKAAEEAKQRRGIEVTSTHSAMDKAPTTQFTEKIPPYLAHSRWAVMATAHGNRATGKKHSRQAFQKAPSLMTRMIYVLTHLGFVGQFACYCIYYGVQLARRSSLKQAQNRPRRTTP